MENLCRKGDKYNFTSLFSNLICIYRLGLLTSLIEIIEKVNTISMT